MEIFKKYKCIKYGKNENGMLFVMEHGGRYLEAKDTSENRSIVEEKFNSLKKSFNGIGNNCSLCHYKHECHDWS